MREARLSYVTKRERSTIREIHEVLASTPGDPPDIAKVAEVMRRHGLTPAPPPS